MSFTAPHIGFVLASYGFSAIVLIGLLTGILAEARRARQRLDDLEQRHAARRKPAKGVESV